MLKRMVLGSSPLLAFLAAGLVSKSATSDTLAGSGGHAWLPADTQCFQANWGEIRHTGATGCEGFRKWLMPVPVRSTGTRTLSVRAFGGSFGGGFTLQCRAVKTDGSNSFTISSNGWQTTSGVGSYQTLLIGTVTLNAGDALHFDCETQSQGRIATVDWAQ